MKQDIHPQYYPEAKAVCGCGNKVTVGASVPEIQVEICSKCHPFYTGSQELIDTTGRVERFKARRAKASTHTKVRKDTKVRKKKVS
ncbi:MAG: 50S ribosomal protein L31 [Candidatus Jorgensenbacteria bacterium]